MTGIAFGFVFDEEYSRILDDGFRQERQSYVTRTPAGHRINEPGTQRDAYVKEIRIGRARLITNWFSSNLPGLCSKGLLEGALPTCEFATLRKAQSFPSRTEDAGDFKWYLFHLGLDHGFDSWRDQSVPSLRFNPLPRNQNIPNYHSILSIKEHSWKNQIAEKPHESNRDLMTYKMHERMSGLIGI